MPGVTSSSFSKTWLPDGLQGMGYIGKKSLIKMELPFDLAIPLLGLYPKNTETAIQKSLCTPMFIVAQFTIAKCWKQPKCPSVNQWIKKL